MPTRMLKSLFFRYFGKKAKFPREEVDWPWRKDSKKPVLIGTWKAARWAVSFYEKHGFRLVDEEEKNRLLRKYWTIPDRQVETSVVLVNEKYKPSSDF